MKLSGLKLGFCISVATHGLILSIAPLIRPGHGDTRIILSSGNELVLQIIAVPEQKDSSGSEVRPSETIQHLPEPLLANNSLPSSSEELVIDPITSETAGVLPEIFSILAVPPNVPEPAIPLAAIESVTSQASKISLGSRSLHNSVRLEPLATADGKPLALDGLENKGFALAAAESQISGLESCPAHYLFNPKPVYPREARKHRDQGLVIVSAFVTCAGYPQSVSMAYSSGFTSLDQAALNAVKMWRFTPAKNGAIKVACRVEVPISFTLSR